MSDACNCGFGSQGILQHHWRCPVSRKPKKVVDLMAKEADEGLMPVETPSSLAPPLSADSKCQWERCVEPATSRMRWRREKYNGREDAFDTANYCDGHAHAASTHGAVLVERLA